MRPKKTTTTLLIIGAICLSSPAFAAQWGVFTYEESGGKISISGYTCPGGTAVIPDTIDGKPVVRIGNLAFAYCTGLTGVTIPSSITNIAYAAFNGCTSLTSVTIPGSVIDLEQGAFFGCTGLTSITIMHGAKTIGIDAFYGCTGLTSVAIPSSITSIGTAAFFQCAALARAYFYGNAPSMGATVFDGCASGFTVYYKADSTGFINPWYGYPATSCTDTDNDGYAIEGGGCGAIDCNDNNSSINPGASDITCNGIDNNCDNQTDEGYVPDSSCFLPGACAAGNAASSCSSGFETACATGTPSSDANCDGIDNNCDNQTDEGYVPDSSCFLPGACAAGNAASSCSAGLETACATGTPSSDANCDGIDNDCSGTADEDYVSQSTNCGVGACAATGSTSCVAGGVVNSCTPGSSTDEICNGIDDDCNGEIDDGLTFMNYYRDADNDTYGNADNATVACEEPEGYVDNSTGFDCNDDNADINPAAAEVCGDGIDNNCDNVTDDNCSTCTDADGDGYFVGEGCTPVDCDDSDWKIHEGCEANPCSLQILPKQIFKSVKFFVPFGSYIITADKDSGVDFGTFKISFSSDAIRTINGIKIGKRIILGFFVVNPFKLVKGDTTAEVEIYGESPEILCADFTVK